MEFLNYEQMNENLSQSEVNLSVENINNDQIELIRNKIELKPSEEIARGKCLVNAYEVAKITGAGIIEGVARILVKNKEEFDETIIKHAWNELNGIQFDITKDLVWPNLIVKLEQIDYYEAKKFTVKDYSTVEGVIEFKSDVDLFASSLRYLKTKEQVQIALQSRGLDKEFHEQLLNDCISTIKKTNT